MTTSAKLTSKFQMTIPVAIRRRLGIEAGDLVTLTVEGGEVVLRAAKGSCTAGSRGLGAAAWMRSGGGEAAIERERDAWK
jgi:AbrB family looped-hinge helix DNA binding protein